jgi:hypothetical protein
MKEERANVLHAHQIIIDIEYVQDRPPEELIPDGIG